MSSTKFANERTGNILAVIALLISIIILVGFTVGSSSIIWLLLIVNFVSGPACLFFYLLEVKKGVFKNMGQEEE